MKSQEMRSHHRSDWPKRIPAVLAMQGKVSMQTIAEFMPVFFQELQKDGMIDRALTVARGVVRSRPDYWMPVLFMRLKSGRIWYVPGFGEGHEFRKWYALIAYIKNKSCTPILGPGLFEPLLGSLGDIAQSWAEDFHYPLSPADLDSLPRVAQYFHQPITAVSLPVFKALYASIL
jgi:hypothetical protein